VTSRPCLLDAAADTVPAVFTRPAYLLLVLALLAARVTCAWGLGVDPCCGEEGDLHAASVASHMETEEPGHESEVDHAVHAGHCHCLWEAVAEPTVVPPAVAPPVRGVDRHELPAVEPRGIDRPPQAHS